jgi:hypothetical protein
MQAALAHPKCHTYATMPGCPCCVFYTTVSPVQPESTVTLDAGDCGMLGGRYGIRTYGVSSSCTGFLVGIAGCSCLRACVAAQAWF